MDRDQQYQALISALQNINALVATIVITEPEVFPDFPRVAYAPGMSWELDGVKHAFHTQTFKLAMLKSGMMSMRTLSNFLGIGVSSKLPYVLIEKSLPGPTSDDLHWSHVVNARALTLNDVNAFSRLDHPLIDEHNTIVPFSEMYLRTLKASDKVVAHLTHDSEWSSPYYGAILGVGTFLISAIQIAVLQPSWNDTFDELVFANTRLLLPSKHLDEYLKMFNAYHADLQLVLA